MRDKDVRQAVLDILEDEPEQTMDWRELLILLVERGAEPDQFAEIIRLLVMDDLVDYEDGKVSLFKRQEPPPEEDDGT